MDPNLARLKSNKKLMKLSPGVPPKRRESAPTNSIFFSTTILDTKIESTKQLRYFDLDSLQDQPKEFKNELSLGILNKEYEGYEKAEGSGPNFLKTNPGIVKSYAYNTYVGIVKKTNEDKVSVCDLIKKPSNSNVKQWPKMSYFSIFDGHGGQNCSIFLKENLLTYITENKNFPLDIKASILGGYEKAEEEFKKKYMTTPTDDSEKSGSCALIVLVVDNKIYIANVGDSRAIISMEKGAKFKSLTIDHKPNNPKEFERITKNGGKVYIDNDKPVRDINEVTVINQVKEFDKYCMDKEVIYRAYPCDLGVTRTIGDFYAKVKEVGGIPGVISSVPEIFTIDNMAALDFIIMGCDGIFDELENAQIIETCWYILNKPSKDKNYDINSLTKDVCDMVIKTSMHNYSGDNLSCIIIGLEGLEKAITLKKSKEKRDLIRKVSSPA